MKKKPKKAKTSIAARKARGPHCVYTPSKKLFNCFAEKTSAAKVVAGMNKGYKKTCSNHLSIILGPLFTGVSN